MNLFQAVGAIGLPIAMVLGAIAAWRASKKDDAAAAEKPAWRDDSLDEWRRDRARQADEEREARHLGSELHTGRPEEETAEKKHQRIGG